MNDQMREAWQSCEHSRYGSGEFLAWLLERSIQPYIPVIDRRHQTHRHFTRDQFQYDQVENVFHCPQGQTLRYRGMDRQAQGYLYQTAAEVAL